MLTYIYKRKIVRWALAAIVALRRFVNWHLTGHNKLAIDYTSNENPFIKFCLQF